MKPGRSSTARKPTASRKLARPSLNVTDSKIIKLFVDDEPFWLPNANFVRYDRRLNMQSGTLDREILWETPAGKQVLITSRRLVSFVHRHVAAISYRVTLLNAAAPVVIASEMVANAPSARANGDDPRQASVFAGRVLQHRASYAKDRRIVLCHATEKSRLTLTCATDHALETACPHTYKAVHTEDFRPGRLHDRGPARLSDPPHQIHGLSHVANGVVGRTLRPCRVDAGSRDAPGVPAAAHRSRAVHGRFLAPQRCPGQRYQEDRMQRTTVEIQQAIRFNLFHILQASARAEDAGVPAKGLTGQAYEGHYFWDTEIYLLPFLTYTSPGSPGIC